MKDQLPTAKAAELELRRLANPRNAAFAQKFFRTEKGGYGEGDSFLGLSVPTVRGVARRCNALDGQELAKLLDSKWHEARLMALAILAQRAEKAFKKKDANSLKAVFGVYRSRISRIDNWDLVDVAAPAVVGSYFLVNNDAERKRWLASKQLWERRIAYVSLLQDIRRAKRVDRVFRCGPRLPEDSHDLMHKALGWVLREAGKVDPQGLEAFIERYGKRMPRTALRYAIERWPQAKRKRTLIETRGE